MAIAVKLSLMNIKFFGDFEMKHPILCTFLALVLTFTTALPFTGLHATELWNSQKKGSNSKDGGKVYYYNKSKSSPTAKGGITLYNRQAQQSYSSHVGGGIKSTIESYKKVKYSGQHPSDLWKYMSDSAVQNRQADIDNALQVEYETRQKTAAHMANMLKEVQVAQVKAEQSYQKELAEYEALKKAEELEKQKKKEYALNGGKNYKSYSSSKKNTYTSSKASGKKSIYNKSASSKKSTTIKMKKPPKLFNSPNK